ncbi:cell envelope integrity protein TolA [Bdellovibrio sp. HCB337]|uniref:cell envelope integrity protein TolA n=1 Tax=Bdellovibrio sp. HCB337 TaxID=3394358 RepID=UPI0039A64192
MKRSLSIALLLSLALHLLLGGGVAIYTLTQTPPVQPKTVTIEILDQEPVQKPDVAVKKQKVKIDTTQIVEQEENALNKEKPEDARFMSANDQKVAKQTQALNHGDFQNKKTKDTKAGKPVESKKSAPKLDQLLAAYDPLAAGMKKQEAKTKQEAEAAQKGGDVSQTSDYLKDVDQGIETLLNTREFKYYTYYNRIRKQLSQYWEPKVRQKVNTMFQQGRKIASTQDRITKLLIVLNESGTLVNVQVLSDSGIRDLDDAAIEAFRSAAPFPNPPKGIIETDGTVKIRWDFVLET